MNKFLTNRQIALILYSSVFAYGIISLPKDVSEVADTGSWFSILVTTLIFILMTYIITYLQYVYTEKTLYEYCEQLIGKLAAKVISIVIIVYLFLFFSMVVRVYSEIMKEIFLYKTPIIAISILIYIVAGYALIKGINTIARLCEIYCIINILGFILMTSILATKGSFINIQPLFFSDDLIKYLKAVPKIITPFLGIESLYFLPLNKEKNRNIFKYNTLIVALAGIMYIFIVEVCISVVGVDAIIYYKIPLFSIIKGVEIYHLELFRRLDGACMFFWSLNIISSICIRIYSIMNFSKRISNNIQPKYVVSLLIILGLIVTQIPKTSEQLELIIKYNSYLGIVMAVVLPSILFFITKVKKYDKHM